MPTTPTYFCTNWVAGSFFNPLTPLSQYIFIVDPTDQFYVGQNVSSIDFNNPAIEEGVGGYTILTIVYLSTDETTVYFENGPNRTVRGVIIVDTNNTMLIPKATGSETGHNSGNFCVLIPETPNPDITCYVNEVWEKQCEFAKCVLAYLQGLQFGSVACDALDKLMSQKRILKILNCYDTRDIPGNTVDYNILTYNQIKKLLNH
jgi:hypothetical protein